MSRQNDDNGNPTPERFHQNGGVISEVIDYDLNGGGFINRYKAVWECPLDFYLDRKVIGKPEHSAGLKFRQAYRDAVLSNYAARQRLKNYSTFTELTMSEKLVKEAYKTVPSTNMGVVIDVCGHDQITYSSHAYEKLRKGLGHLAIHWHMMAIEVCEHKGRKE